MCRIMILGHASAGKTTLTNYLIKKGYIQLIFAGPIKNFLMDIGYSYDQVNGTSAQKVMKHKDFNMSGRDLAQKYGTELMRDLFPDVCPDFNLNGYKFWARVAEYKLNEFFPNAKVVFADGRMEDEAEMVRKNGGYIIKISRKKDESCLNEEQKNHTSETSINNIVSDFTIENDGTFEELYEKMDAIMRQIDPTYNTDELCQDDVDKETKTIRSLKSGVETLDEINNEFKDSLEKELTNRTKHVYAQDDEQDMYENEQDMYEDKQDEDEQSHKNQSDNDQSECDSCDSYTDSEPENQPIRTQHSFFFILLMTTMLFGVPSMFVMHPESRTETLITLLFVIAVFKSEITHKTLTIIVYPLILVLLVEEYLRNKNILSVTAY